MENNRVNLDVRDGIACVTLNRAEKRNALDMAMFRAIDRVSRALRSDRDIRAVVVHAAGEDFCTGLDVKSVMSQKSSVLALLAKWWPRRANLAQRVSHNWRRIPVPVIMAIQGRCWGGGFQIALGGDFRIATADATFSVMEGKWGLVPDMAGNLGLRELAPKDIALRLAMTAEIFDAASALEYRLITEIHEDPLQRAMALAGQIADRSPDAVAAVKKLYRRNWFKSDGSLLSRESLYQWRVLFGKNQARAVRRQQNPEQNVPYLRRMRW